MILYTWILRIMRYLQISTSLSTQTYEKTQQLENCFAK